ncbi:MAG: flavin reductase [Clostridia bacterium]|nr:flavin reductase [Clostridia bacterium]
MNPKALYNITYGVYLLSAKENGRDNACIINTAVQVANNPTRISIAAIKGNLTHDMIAETGVCNLSAITTDADFSLFRHFGMQSGRNTDKFSDFTDVTRSENGLYYLTKWSSAFLSLKITESHDLGSHTLFIGEVVDGEVLSRTDNCTYGYYQTVIKAAAPKPASTAKTGWRCKVCGHVYEGEDLPADYICPLCKHGAEDFEKIGDEPAAVPVSAPVAPAPAAGGKKYVCAICGYVHEGDEAPEKCPICNAPADKFTLQGDDRTWAAEHVVGVANGVPEDIIADLRANFNAECMEVGMYLAMARVAHREGYPEIGKYWEKAAWEEAEHAAKFAELLGDIVTDSTEQNLRVRVDAEFGATAGKFDLAKRAKALNLDAIHDTVHEMARDEARHGKAFEGFLKRYFGK